MQRIFLIAMLLLGSVCANAGAIQPETLTVGPWRLALNFSEECTKPRISSGELAKNLSQYDPSRDPRSDIRDETPRSRREIAEIKKQLVEDGFVYPNGRESVITWMDFDLDGICDFTATVGIGGMRSTERMMLFRGLANGKFKLVDSHLSFMDSTITLIPYIPVSIAGNRVPIIVIPREGRMLRWREDGAGFESCDTNMRIGDPLRLQNTSSSDFAQLCGHFRKIADWAQERLPEENEMNTWSP